MKSVSHGMGMDQFNKYACSLLTAESSLQPDRETGAVIVESG